MNFRLSLRFFVRNFNLKILMSRLREGFKILIHGNFFLSVEKWFSILIVMIKFIRQRFIICFRVTCLFNTGFVTTTPSWALASLYLCLFPLQCLLQTFSVFSPPPNFWRNSLVYIATPSGGT